MKKFLLVTFIGLSFFPAAFAQNASNAPVIPATQSASDGQDRLKWFREARFGMFIHFGLYSILGGTYGGHTLPDPKMRFAKDWYAEWIQTRLEVPTATYQALVKRFNPTSFDADRWASDAASAGMRYVVITSKHHEGFALWNSAVSKYTIAASPFKNRDILGELAKACRKRGLKFGFYYSHWQDWEAPGGAWPSWSSVKRTPEEFKEYWERKCLPQVTELIERYDPDVLWFDTWGDHESDLITPAMRDELIALIHKLSPKCLINGRILMSNPGPDVDFLDMGDNRYPDKIIATPWEAPATMENSWGWHAGDHNWKPVSALLGNLLRCTSRGGNYILNIGPKPDGLFPAEAVDRLHQIGAWMKVNGEAIYGADPVPDIPFSDVVTLTQKTENGKKDIYAALLSPPPGDHLDLPLPAKNVVQCKILGRNIPLKFTAAGDMVSITVPKSQNLIPVVKITMRP